MPGCRSLEKIEWFAEKIDSKVFCLVSNYLVLYVKRRWSKYLGTELKESSKSASAVVVVDLRLFIGVQYSTVQYK